MNANATDSPAPQCTCAIWPLGDNIIKAEMRIVSQVTHFAAKLTFVFFLDEEYMPVGIVLLSVRMCSNICCPVAIDAIHSPVYGVLYCVFAVNYVQVKFCENACILSAFNCFAKSISSFCQHDAFLTCFFPFPPFSEELRSHALCCSSASLRPLVAVEGKTSAAANPGTCT